MANWELGVVFTPELGSKDMKKRIMDTMIFRYPSSKYDLTQDIPFIIENMPEFNE